MASPGVPISGRKLRAVRFQRRLTTTQLAEKLGCSPAYIRQMELDTKNPSFDMLSKLEAALDVTADDLGAQFPT